MAVPAAAGSLTYVRPTTTVFELEALEGLPCGCVAAAYRARPWDVAVVSLEAKGTYCGLMEHVMGRATAVPAAVTTQIAVSDLGED